MLNFLGSLSGEVPAFIFLGGIHGVGKTTVCNRIFVPAGYHCVTASSLIKAHGKKTDQDKRVDSVADNQVALIQQLRLEKETHHYLLLDGHFCLINGQNCVEMIDPKVFQVINPTHLVLIKGSPEKILKRLSERDGKDWDLYFITQFQKMEEVHATRVSNELGIPLRIFMNE